MWGRSTRAVMRSAQSGKRVQPGKGSAAAATRPHRCRTSGIVASGVSHMNHEAVGVTGSSSWRKLFTTPARGMARYEGEMPQLGPDDFVVLSPEVSGPGGMSVPAELGEVYNLTVQEGDEAHEDMVVAEIETCKASVEARCRTAGVIKKVLVQDGEEVWELQPLMIVTRAAA
mmetsp:Transcript_36155/g.30454  ORF Transcript_36155/g.30454 Transcript_36155/m.30454 type:complete len:172 (+) Transcript_36155:43-558(+)